MSIDLATHFARSQKAAPPSHLGSRYNRAGQFLPEPGNTVVCHLQAGSQTEQALADARRRFATMPDAAKLALTPLESYHMTLFQGVIEGRRTHPYWPTDIAGDAPIDTVTADFLRRLDGLAAGPHFDVEVIQVLPTGLIVDGVTAADRDGMAQWRDALAACFGYRHGDHDSYVFHITMAYLIDWIADEDLPGWQAMLDEVLTDIRQRAPVLALRAPAFCSFADMNWFEELRVLPPR